MLSSQGSALGERLSKKVYETFAIVQKLFASRPSSPSKIRWATHPVCIRWQPYTHHTYRPLVCHRPDHRSECELAPDHRFHIGRPNVLFGGDQRGARDGQDLAHEREDGKFQNGRLVIRVCWWSRADRPVSSSGDAAGEATRAQVIGRRGGGTVRSGRW
jgi:hypothetical protein